MSPKKIILVNQKASNKSIDKAWKVISSIDISYESAEYQEAYNVISERRWLHTYPLNTFQANLRKKMTSLWLDKEDYIISQRLKRIVSIIKKLQRFPKTQLSRLQDIWWIRAIVPDMDSVNFLSNIYLKNEFKSYKLSRVRDYISEPKVDWYRSLHLIFEYNNSRLPQTMWLNFEFQIRTFVQHARATAVETIGTFIGASLKSNEWPEEWLEYFRYVSIGFSYLEWTKIHEDFFALSQNEVKNRVLQMTKDLWVKEKIKWFSVATKIINEQLKKAKWAKFFVIKLNTIDRWFRIQGFKTRGPAILNYKIMELQAFGSSWLVVVLVSIDQIKDLQKAYPSYFWDNELFIENLNKLLDF